MSGISVHCFLLFDLKYVLEYQGQTRKWHNKYTLGTK